MKSYTREELEEHSEGDLKSDCIDLGADAESVNDWEHSDCIDYILSYFEGKKECDCEACIDNYTSWAKSETII
jgi:hypothetical protein